MPGRNIPLVNNEIYHVINRGIAAQPIFYEKRDYDRKIATIAYYRYTNPTLRYSFYIRLPSDRRLEYIEVLDKKGDFLVEILAYCLMPNHIHLLLRQTKDNGISIFMSNISNSYTRYLNTKNDRVGPIYQGKFKAVRVERDEQFRHVQRYIHLNPYSSYIIKDIKNVEKYPFSSLQEYLGNSTLNLCNKKFVMDYFKNIGSLKKFIFDQADYQRKLDTIKHLSLEK